MLHLLMNYIATAQGERKINRMKFNTYGGDAEIIHMGIIYVTNLYVNSLRNKEFNKQFYEYLMCCAVLCGDDFYRLKWIESDSFLVNCELIDNLINLMIFRIASCCGIYCRLLPREMRIVFALFGLLKWVGILWNF